jgi:hypothetical protein
VADRYENKYLESIALKEKMDKEMDDLDSRISRLRVLYDQYFMGIERVEPIFLRNSIEKDFRRSNILRRGSTVLKFRYRSLQQKYTAYRSYWNRIVRLIEDGQIRRGIGLKNGLPGEGNAPRVGDGEQRFAQPAPLSSRRHVRSRTDGEQSLEEAAGNAAAQLRDNTGNGPREFAPDDLDNLYDSLISAKSKAGESTTKLSRTIVEKSVGRIVEKMAGKSIRFRIIEKDGKVNLSAVVKKK